MFLYLLKRSIDSFLTFFCLLTLTFCMVKAAPGGPFDQERKLPPEVEKNLMKAYHLDEPFYKQYIRYVGGILRGDFGPSFQYKDFTVSELIYKGFPISFKIALCAVSVAVLFGIPIGIVAALKKNNFLDYVLMSCSLWGIIIPSYVFAPILSLFFGVFLRILPVAGWEGGDFRHMVLPVFSLALPQIAYIARLMRVSMIEILNSPYMQTVKAKGMPMKRLIFVHAIKPAILPVITYLAPAAATLMSGAIAIERIYAIPGLGTFFINGAINRDYTLVMGGVVVFGTFIILGNWLVDIIYSFLDPKIRCK